MRAEIAKLWNEGWTGGEIAAEYGMSRNSVIGMANRNRDIFISKPPPKALVKVTQVRRDKRDRKQRVKKMQTEKRVIIAPVPPTLPGPGTYTLMDLGPRSCRWPVNEGHPFLFCGAITEDHNQVYCNHHRAKGTVATVYKPRKPMKVPQ